MKQLTRFWFSFGQGLTLMTPSASALRSQLWVVLFLKDRSEWRSEGGRGRQEKNMGGGGVRDACSTKGFTKGLKQDEH